MTGPPEREPARRIWPTVLGIVLVAGAAAYVARHWQEVVQGFEPHPRWLLVAGACEVGLVGLRAALLRRACRPFEIDIGLREAAGLISWATFANYLMTVVGGTGVRAAYLKKRYGLELPDFMSLTGALYALSFLIVAVAGLLSTIWVRPVSGIGALQCFFAAVATLCLALLVLPWPAPRGRGVVARLLRRVTRGRRLLSGRPLGRLLPILLLYVPVGAAALYAYFRFAGWTFEPQEALLVSSLSELSMLVAVTPAGLGVLESAMGLGASLVGTSLGLGLAVAGARRVATTVVALLLALQYPIWKRTGRREEAQGTSAGR